MKKHYKIIKCNNIYEVYSYRSIGNNNKNCVLSDHVEIDDDEKMNVKFDNYKRTLRKRRENVRRLITMNFDNSDKFVTLTFRNTDLFDIENVKDTNREFKKFIQRLKRYLEKNNKKELKYVTVIEFQKRGAIHYHCIMNIPFIKNKELAKIWGNGFVKVNKIDYVDNVGAYVVKYMSKEFDDNRLMGEKGYLCSKYLDRPLILKSWDSLECFEKSKIVLEFLKNENKNNDSLVYETDFVNEFNEINYKQYNLSSLYYKKNNEKKNKMI